MIMPQLPISDHCQLILHLKRSETKLNFKNPEPKIFPLPKTFRWTDENVSIYESDMHDHDSKLMIDNFMVTQYHSNVENVNMACNHLNNILIHLVKKIKCKTNI